MNPRISYAYVILRNFRSPIGM